MSFYQLVTLDDMTFEDNSSIFAYSVTLIHIAKFGKVLNVPDLQSLPVSSVGRALNPWPSPIGSNFCFFSKNP